MESLFISIWKGIKWAAAGVARTFSKRPGLLRWACYAVAAVLVLCVAFIGMVWVGIFGRVPDQQALRSINNQVATEVYSADSVLLGRYYLQERSPVTPSQVPEGLRNALISTEDARFYKHDGIDIRSLFRVFIKTLALQDESAGGGSTLTQQLAKNLFPRRSYMFLSMPINKVKEMIIAQ